MTSPSSSIDMDISDGSDHESVSNLSDMEVANSDDEISENPIINMANSSTPMDAQQRQQLQQQIVMQAHELASAPSAAGYAVNASENLQQSYAYYNDAAWYGGGSGPSQLPVPPTLAQYHYHDVHYFDQPLQQQRPVKIPSTPSPNRQIHINPSKHNAFFDSIVTTAATPGSTTTSLAATATAASSDKKINEDMDKYDDDDDDDSDSLSSYVTAPLYTVNESEEEPGLIRDEDEDDLETLAWYKHVVSKYDAEIEATKKEKRALEQELLRFQVVLSMEKNKMKSRSKGKKKARKERQPSRIATTMSPQSSSNPSKPLLSGSLPSPSITTTTTENEVAQKEGKKKTSASSPSSGKESASPQIKNLIAAAKSVTLSPPADRMRTFSQQPAIPQPSKPVTGRYGTVGPSMPSIPQKRVSAAAQPSAESMGPGPSIPSPLRPPSHSTSKQQPLKKHQPVTVSAASTNNQRTPPANVASAATAKTPALRSLQNQRANAITAHNSGSKLSINPATTKIVENHRGNKGAFKPYESPLQRFGFSNTSNIISSSSSGSISNNNNGVNDNSNSEGNNNEGNGLSVENVNRELCSFETVGGQCNDDTCPARHFRDFYENKNT